MTYPEVLLPQQIFKKIETDLSGFSVCRKCFLKLEDLSNHIPSESLLGIEKESDCFDFSTHLPGIFELHHNAIELLGGNKKYFRSYWDWHSKVQPPTFEKDFEINPDVGFFFLNIGDVERVSIPYNIKQEINHDNRLKPKVIHTPTNCNFWHFSITWQNSAGEEISVNSSKWKRSIISTIRVILAEFISFGPVCQEIKSEWYLRD